jgi:hypothetical protein
VSAPRRYGAASFAWLAEPKLTLGVAREGIWLTEPKLTLGVNVRERRMVDLTGIEPVTS